MRQLLPIALLVLAACGSSDPTDLTTEGYAVLNKGDAKAAIVKLDGALEKLAPTDQGYYRAALGRCQALAKIDPPAAKQSFLDLAKRLGKSTVREDDYGLLCSELVRADATVVAIEVMHAGMETFDKSEKMKQILDEVVTAAKRASTPDALKKLETLGYT